MNAKAAELGLVNTHFETPHGLDSDKHYTTAYELALLSNYALNNKIFAQIVGTKEYTITINNSPKQLSNTNELLGNFAGIYGIKTGFTNGANRCLVTACKRNDIDIICVVLGADTKKFRTKDSVKLINYIFDNFEIVNLEDVINKKFETWKKENLEKITINKAYTQDINLKIEDISIKSIPVHKDMVDNIEINIECPMYFEAPISSNLNVGSVDISISNFCNFKYYIYNVNEIKRKNSFNYFFELLKNYIYITNSFVFL